MSGSGVGTNVNVFSANAIHAGTRYTIKGSGNRGITYVCVLRGNSIHGVTRHETIAYKIKGSGNRVITYVYVCRADSTHTVTRHEILACVGRGT